MAKVGKKKLDYRNIGTSHVETSLVEYKKFVIGVVKQNPFYLPALKDEDLFTNLVTEAAMADWRFDPTKGMKKESFKYAAIIFFLRKNYQKESANHMVTVDDLSYIINNQKGPVQLAIEKEQELVNKKYVTNLLNATNLTPLEREYVNLHYYKNMPVVKIAEQYNVSRQSVDIKIKHAVSKLQQAHNDTERPN